MKILFSPPAALQFLAAAVIAGENEFSGVGFCKRTKDALEVYDLRVLHYGSYASTTITPEALAEVLSEPGVVQDDLRVWIHKHPLGNGKPGKDNWSSTDDQTILNSPLGGIPELVGWSASVVLTPRGPVGRIDNHLAKRTQHVPVELPFVDLHKMCASRSVATKKPAGLVEKLNQVVDDLEWLLEQVSPGLAEAINDLEHLAFEQEEAWTTSDTAPSSTPATLPSL